MTILSPFCKKYLYYYELTFFMISSKLESQIKHCTQNLFSTHISVYFDRKFLCNQFFGILFTFALSARNIICW